MPRLVTELYGLVQRLEAIFPGRRFTPDGHLVGSIGEVVAASRYRLKLLPASAEGHDAETSSGLKVQIKTTQGRSVGIRSEPQYLLVVVIDKQGQVTEAFNGPGATPWAAAGKMQRNGQRTITLYRLGKLMDEIPPTERLPDFGPAGVSQQSTK